MKDKIIIFIAGLFLGAIISTGSIYFYTVANNKSSSNQTMEMNGTTPPNMNGEQGMTPRELPNENNAPNNNSTNSN